MIRSITFQDQVSVSFNQLNQRWSLKELLKHTVSHFLTIVLYCRSSCDGTGGWRQRQRWRRRCWGADGHWQVSSCLFLKECIKQGLKRHLRLRLIHFRSEIRGGWGREHRCGRMKLSWNVSSSQRRSLKEFRMHCYAFVMLYLKDGPLRSSECIAPCCISKTVP